MSLLEYSMRTFEKQQIILSLCCTISLISIGFVLIVYIHHVSMFRDVRRFLSLESEDRDSTHLDQLASKVQEINA